MSPKSMLLAALAVIAMSGAAAAADFTFKYGNSQPEAAARSQSMIFFKNEVEKRSGGRIEVQNFFSNVLGTEQEMFDQVATGLIQGTRGGFFANANPEFNILVLPFLVNNWDEAKCLVKSDLMMGIQERAGNNGIHVPATAISQGFRMYTNNVRPITKVDDLQGLKIREPQTDAFIAVARALGSNVQAMAFSEVYQAFKQGVIDGQHNPPANIYNYKIYEVQKYLSVTAIPADAARGRVWRAGTAVSEDGVSEGHTHLSRCRAMSTLRLPRCPLKSLLVAHPAAPHPRPRCAS